MKPRRVVTVLLPAVSGLSRDLVRGIAEYAEAQGDWHLVLELYGMVRPDSFQAIQQGDGVLTESLLPLSNPVSPQWKIPVVGLQDLQLLRHGPVVSTDNPATGRMAGEYFLEKGMTHLAYVSYAEGNQTEQGLRATAAASEVSCQSYYLGGEKPELDVRARKRLMNWFEALPVPTGVLFRDDQLARKFMDFLPAAWLPERMGLLGIGNDPLICGLARPGLSSIERDGRTIGRKAAELLHRIMDGEDLPASPHLIPPSHVVERDSTGIEYTPDPLVTRAVRRMEEHLQNPESIEALARALGSSRRTLERRFERALGRSVWRERRHLQIRRARHFLRNTDKSLAWISDHCGFSSPPQFSRVFHEEVGVTPRKYRMGK